MNCGHVATCKLNVLHVFELFDSWESRLTHENHIQLLPIMFELIGIFVSGVVLGYHFWTSTQSLDKQTPDPPTPPVMSESEIATISNQLASMAQAVRHLGEIGSVTRRETEHFVDIVRAHSRLLNRMDDDVRELKTMSRNPPFHPIQFSHPPPQEFREDPHSLGSQAPSSRPVPPAPRHDRNNTYPTPAKLMEILQEFRGTDEGRAMLRRLASEETGEDCATKDGITPPPPVDTVVYTDPDQCHDVVRHVTTTIEQPMSSWGTIMRTFGDVAGLTDVGRIARRQQLALARNRLVRELNTGREYHKMPTCFGDVNVEDDPILEYNTRKVIAICQWVATQNKLCVLEEEDANLESSGSDSDSSSKSELDKKVAEAREDTRHRYQTTLDTLETQFAEYAKDVCTRHPELFRKNGPETAFATVRQVMAPIA